MKNNEKSKRKTSFTEDIHQNKISERIFCLVALANDIWDSKEKKKRRQSKVQVGTCNDASLKEMLFKASYRRLSGKHLFPRKLSIT